MSSGGHIETFVSIVLGIAVSDLIISFHRLMTSDGKVRWDWRLLLLAAYQLLMLIESWWASFDWFNGDHRVSIAAFLPNVTILILSYLAAAAILPDDVPPDGIDLRAFYWRRARYFWTLVSLQLAVIFVFIAPRSIGPATTWLSFIDQWWDNAVGMAMIVILLAWRRERVHTIGILAYAALFASDFVFQAIG